MSGVGPGDLVVFTGASRVQAVGRIAVILNNTDFADLLWPRDSEGRSYQVAYSVVGLRFPARITYDDLRLRGGFGPKEPFRRVAAVGGPTADRLEASFADGRVDDGGGTGATRIRDIQRSPVGVALESEASHQDAALVRTPLLEVVAGRGELDVFARVASFTGETDAPTALRAARREQRLLRDALGIRTGVHEAQCGVCGRRLPSALLIAAHIKRRSACSEAERLDIPHVAMLACALGCDALFEAGYLAVDGAGRIVTARRHLRPSALQNTLRELERRTAPAWTAAREPYFAWHLAHAFIGGRGASHETAHDAQVDV